MEFSLEFGHKESIQHPAFQFCVKKYSEMGQSVNKGSGASESTGLSSLSLNEDQLEELLESTKYKKEEIKKWYNSFTKDSEHGKMDREQFYDFYSKLFATEDKSWVKKDLIFDAFDVNNDGQVSFKELMTTLSILRRGPIAEKVEWLFDLYDINGNNEISAEEFMAIVECLREVGTLRFSVDKMNTIFQNIDGSKDGVVTKEEFLEGIQSYPELMSLFNCRQVLPVL